MFFGTVCVKVLVCLNFLKTFSTFVCLAYSAMSFIYFLSDGIDKHMSEPLILKNTDVFSDVLL